MTGLVVALAFFSTLGCKAKIDRDDVLGTYWVQYPYGIMHLVIKSDGTYEELFGKNREPLASINRAEWTMIQMSGEINLNLFDPILIDDGFGKYKPKKVAGGRWPLRVRRSLWGRVYLPINDDQGFVFKKINN